jgi:hypothetical protein
VKFFTNKYTPHAPIMSSIRDKGWCPNLDEGLSALFTVLLNDSSADSSSGGVDGRLVQHYDESALIGVVYSVRPSIAARCHRMPTKVEDLNVALPHGLALE